MYKSNIKCAITIQFPLNDCFLEVLCAVSSRAAEHLLGTQIRFSVWLVSSSTHRYSNWGFMWTAIIGSVFPLSVSLPTTLECSLVDLAIKLRCQEEEYCTAEGDNNVCPANY